MQQINFLKDLGAQINTFISGISDTPVNILKSKTKTKTSKITKPKVQKDSNRPKKPADVTAVYIKDQKKNRPEEFENLSKKECNRVLTREWAQVSDGVRDRYTKIYQKEMERYRQYLKKERKEREAREREKEQGEEEGQREKE